jgi:hypothetical protein
MHEEHGSLLTRRYDITAPDASQIIPKHHHSSVVDS